LRRILITALAAAAVSIGGVAQAAKPTTIKATPSTDTRSKTARGTGLPPRSRSRFVVI